jgi:hypothetical protein
MKGRVRTPEARLLAIGNLLCRVGVVHRRLGFRAAVLREIVISSEGSRNVQMGKLTQVKKGKSGKSQCERRPFSFPGMPLQIFCDVSTCGVEHFRASREPS